MIALQIAMAPMFGLDVYVAEEEREEFIPPAIEEAYALLELEDHPVCTKHAHQLIGWEETWCPFCLADELEAQADEVLLRSHICPECGLNYADCTCPPF